MKPLPFTPLICALRWAPAGSPPSWLRLILAVLPGVGGWGSTAYTDRDRSMGRRA